MTERVGFFTDTSICIGCKACEVACKEWNGVPDDGFTLLGSSYDNTGALGASTWRHVAFIEQPRRLGTQEAGFAGTPAGPAASDVLNRAGDAALSGDRSVLGTDTSQVDLQTPNTPLPDGGDGRTDFRWLMSSDVCKHCTHAACLDVCPTGSLFRTEFGTVVVQDDICNGCGYCVPACPFGVIDRRIGEKNTKNVGLAQKCTLCYDRVQVGKTPACAQACPTESIQFGELSELRERAEQRLEKLTAAGHTDARLYGADPDDGVDGFGAFFLLLDEPEVYGLPPDPVAPTHNVGQVWAGVFAGAVALSTGIAAAVFGGGR